MLKMKQATALMRLRDLEMRRLSPWTDEGPSAEMGKMREEGCGGRGRQDSFSVRCRLHSRQRRQTQWFTGDPSSAGGLPWGCRYDTIVTEVGAETELRAWP